jgi:hypothetical protein
MYMVFIPVLVPSHLLVQKDRYKKYVTKIEFGQAGMGGMEKGWALMGRGAK